ncbi:hypothetical protein [Natrinema ejinorense]|uniref:hypothetical protein n=1 Tax=Natrinema ejinorense TaxID=373386 RepID=UPI00117E848D|nr:hypothetical protein [Natrinema ejinorense]
MVAISGTNGAAASGSARPGESAERADRDDVPTGSASSRVAIGERPDGATRYVGVVARTVDGRHVVVRGDELLAARRLRSASVDGPAFGD